MAFNPSQTTKVWTQEQWKAISDNKLNVAQMMISVLETVDNIEGVGESALYQQFLLFQKCFQVLFLSGHENLGLCYKGLKLNTGL